MSGNSTIRARLAYIEIDEATCALLREYKDFIKGASRRTRSLLRSREPVPGNRRLLQEPRPHGGAKQAQLRHWATIVEGRFDEAYEASITKIGETHNRIGLDPRWYIGGYNALINGMVEAIAKKLPSSRSANPLIDRLTKER